MLKMLIVDDEAVIRHGIHHAIDWESHGISIAGEANNGQQALRQIADTRPDIVLTDIRMPIMNGIALAEHLRAFDPGVKVIMLTGYNEADYLVSAIKTGVSDFLFKPATSEDILKTVLRIRDALLIERETARQLSFYESSFIETDRYVKDMLWQRMLEGTLSVRKGLDLFAKYRLPIHADQGILLAFRLEDKGHQDFLRVLTSVLKEEAHSIFMMRKDRYVAVTLPAFSRERAQAFTQTIETSALLSPFLQWPAAISALPLTPQTLRERVLAAMGTLERGYLYGQDTRTVWVEDFVETELPQAAVRECMLALFQSIYAQNPSAFALAIADLKNSILTHRPGEGQLTALLGTAFALLGQECRADTLFACRYTAADLVDRLAGMAQTAMDPDDDFIRRALSYAESHLEDRISTDRMAREMNVSVGHFCRRFKEQTGKSFMDWLHGTRIERAKVLLSNPALKYYEIAAQIGYADYKTFAKYFLRYTGTSIRKYRQLHG